MELNSEARAHWTEVFQRVIDESTDDEFVRLSQRLELFCERLDEREQEGSCADDETPFDFGSGY